MIPFITALLNGVTRDKRSSCEMVPNGVRVDAVVQSTNDWGQYVGEVPVNVSMVRAQGFEPWTY